MVNRLLDRQASLLAYLSSAATIFGQKTRLPDDPAFDEIDPGVLRLQARFICNKRLEKIIAVFQRTLEIAGADQKSILREFVTVSPATNKSTLANAREFHEFLVACWRAEPPDPIYLPDVAMCELAIAEARNVVEDLESDTEKAGRTASKPLIRRNRGVVPMRCAYDIRPIFEAGSGDIVPLEGDVSLVITLPAGGREVRIIEVAAFVVEVLTLLDNWTDPSVLDDLGRRDDLVNQLAVQSLIEIRT